MQRNNVQFLPGTATNEYIQIFHGDCSRQRALKLKCENESEVLLSECSVRVKQSGDEDDSS